MVGPGAGGSWMAGAGGSTHRGQGGAGAVCGADCRGVSAAVAICTQAAARANGAFPDSESILTPDDRPQQILLVTNFGLISSADNGKTWLWSCEQQGNALGAFYQQTPAPKNRLFTVAN